MSGNNVMQGVKAVELDGKRYAVLWTSNAFVDREKEIFETQAWKDYVARRDVSGRKDRVWYWHVKGTDFATVVWQDVVGRILLEVAEIDNTPRGDKMFDVISNPGNHPSTLPVGWGTSHGYLYRARDKVGGVYGFVEKFESTILPAHKASNLIGKVKEVLDMSFTAEKKDALIELVGAELAEEMLEEAKGATLALEDAGVAYKAGEEEKKDKKKVAPTPPNFGKTDDGDDEEDEDEDDEDEDEKKKEDKKSADEMYELELDEPLLKEIARHASEYIQVPGTKEIAELLEGYKEELFKEVARVIPVLVLGVKESVVKEALTGKLTLKPYSATKDNGTVVPGDELPSAGDLEPADGEKARKRDPVKAVVSNVMGYE